MKKRINLIWLIIGFIILSSCSQIDYTPMYLKLRINSMMDDEGIVTVALLKEHDQLDGRSFSYYSGKRYYKLIHNNSLDGYPNISNYIDDWYGYHKYYRLKQDSFYLIEIIPPFKDCNNCKNKDSLFFQVQPNRFGMLNFVIKYQPGDTVIKEFYFDNFKLEY